MKIIPFTKKGYQNLRVQLEEEIAKRPEFVKALSRGREMGDLSENGLYKAAKQELAGLDRKIRQLKYLILYGKPVEPLDTVSVQLGHKVTIEFANKTREYEIVGEYEANPKENKISIKSPVGHNLMGRKVGEEVKINTPKGQIKQVIKSISI